MILTFVFPTNTALAFLKPKDNDLLILVQSYIQTKLYLISLPKFQKIWKYLHFGFYSKERFKYPLYSLVLVRRDCYQLPEMKSSLKRWRLTTIKDMFKMCYKLTVISKLECHIFFEQWKCYWTKFMAPQDAYFFLVGERYHLFDCTDSVMFIRQCNCFYNGNNSYKIRTTVAKTIQKIL